LFRVWVECMVILFFFSSRRRHTSFSRDWSSDVCSSDLSTFDIGGQTIPIASSMVVGDSLLVHVLLSDVENKPIAPIKVCFEVTEIGRASCRERRRTWESAAAAREQETE